jgi:hypothetical protein
MSKEIPQEIVDATTNACRAIAMSLVTQDKLSELSKIKKKLTNKNGRDNYCKTALLLWGILSYHLDELDDAMFNRVLMFSLATLNPTLKNKNLKPYFPGVDLEPNPNKTDYSNLSYEMFNWFNRNDSHLGVKIITVTGKHLFALQAFREHLTDEKISELYEAGSLLENNTNGMGVMRSILMDKKIKFNF